MIGKRCSGVVRRDEHALPVVGGAVGWVSDRMMTLGRTDGENGKGPVVVRRR